MSDKIPFAETFIPDAVDLLEFDHQDLTALFEDYERLTRRRAAPGQGQALLREICTLLTVHSILEEEIFYPEAWAVLRDGRAADAAQVDHASVRFLIARALAMSPGTPLQDATVLALGELFEQHAKEEETELFPRLRRTRLDLIDLAYRLSARKEQLVREAATMLASLD